MISSSEQNHLENLKNIHGDRPLMEVLRQLVVQLDQLPAGSERQEEMLKSLKLLTGQHQMPPNASEWLDWLEQNDDSTLSWEKLNTKKERKLVALPEEEKPKENFEMPLGGKQAVWAKALAQQEAKQKGGFVFPSKLIYLICLIAFGYLAYKFIPSISMPDFGSWFSSVSFSSDETNDLRAQDDPSTHWGNYVHHDKLISPWGKEEQMNAFVESLASHNLPRNIHNWLTISGDAYAWKNAVGTPLYLDLWACENQIAKTKTTNVSNLRYLGPVSEGSLSWQFNRFIGSEKSPIMTGTFKQVIKQKERYVDVSIYRLQGKNGVAHRFYYDGLGLLTWSWRIRCEDKDFDGKVSFTKDRKSIVIDHGEFPWGKSKTTLNLKRQVKIMPAIYWPHMRLDEETYIILPYALKLIKAKHYFSMLNPVHHKNGKLDLSNTEDTWREVWLPN